MADPFNPALLFSGGGLGGIIGRFLSSVAKKPPKHDETHQNQSQLNQAPLSLDDPMAAFRTSSLPKAVSRKQLLRNKKGLTLGETNPNISVIGGASRFLGGQGLV